MRLVHVTVPAGKLETVRKALDDEGVDYVVTDETSGREYTAVISFPLPTPAVEPVLDALREVGVSDDAHTVIVDAETVISRRFDQLAEEYEEREENGDRIAREELVARANDLAPNPWNYVILTVVSVVIATAGILLDSASVVVGSMVIAPLIGPAMATSVGTVLDDADLFRQGVRQQLIGLVISIVAATLFAVLVKTTNLVPPTLDPLALSQAAERLRPDFLSLAIALGAGVAGAMSLRSGVSSSLVGVMIAVALVPPIAVVGIGIAWGLPFLVLGSLVLALVNFLSINLAALVTFWYSGYRPEQWFRLDEARSATLKRVLVLVVAIVLLSGFLGGVTYNTFQTASAETQIRTTVAETVEDVPDAELLDVRVERGDNPLVGQPERVVVTVGRPTDGPNPPLASDLASALSDYDVSVQVRYVELQEAG